MKLENNQKQFKGFSLVELSITILIIGVLIAAIVKAGMVVRNTRKISNEWRQSNPAGRTAESIIYSYNNIFWIDATNIDGAENSTINEGDIIATWKDLSIQKNDVIQNVSGYYPTLVFENDLPFAQFSVNNFLRTTSRFSKLDGDTRTIIALLKQEVAADNPYAGSGFISTRTFGHALEGFTMSITKNQNFYAFSRELGGSGVLSSSTLPLNKFHILTFRTKGNVQEMFSGGKKIAKKSFYTWILTKNGELVIGKERHASLNQGYKFQGKIAEIMIFDIFLKDEQIFEVSRFLAKKWRLRDQIDSDGDGVVDANDPTPSGSN